MQRRRTASGNWFPSSLTSCATRRAFLFALFALAGTLLSCLLLGFGLYWRAAAVAAAIVLVLSLLSLLGSAAFYIREVSVALTSVQDEAKDLNFMDLGRV